jgi:hypothetical protein
MVDALPVILEAAKVVVHIKGLVPHLILGVSHLLYSNNKTIMIQPDDVGT